jgi:hypothetical protein
MGIPATIPAREYVPTADQRVVMHGIAWDGRHERAMRSALFPDLDIDLLCSFFDRPTALQAVRAFREALRR